MTESPTIKQTIAELEKAVDLFYSKSQENPEEGKALNDQLVAWAATPESLPIKLAIIATSHNERLRFFVAVNLYHFIDSNGKLFTQEHFGQMAQLFIHFIMNNINRIDKEDTKFVLLSLAALCGMNFSLLEQIEATFPTEVFLMLFADFTEVISNPYFKGRYSVDHNLLDPLKPSIFEKFSQVPFNIHWAQSFQKIFHYCLCPNLCIPYLPQIEQMAENCIQLFTIFFDDSIKMDFSDPNVLLFDTELTVIAIEAAKLFPNFGNNIWKTIFEANRDFFIESDRIEFTENVFKCFFEQMPSLYIDANLFYDIVSPVCTFLIDSQGIYPNELLEKYIIFLFGNIITLYNKHQSSTLGKYIKLIANRFRFVRGSFSAVIKTYISEQPLSPCVILLYSTSLYSENGTEMFIAILQQLFQLEVMPDEGFELVNTQIISNNDLFSSIFPEYIQHCFQLLQRAPKTGSQILKLISVRQTAILASISKTLAELLLPVLPSLDLESQCFIILVFINIMHETKDASALQPIHTIIMITLQTHIESQDPQNILQSIHFCIKLYAEFSQLGKMDIIVEFMKALFPEIFHLLSPILLVPDINIQTGLCDFVHQAGLHECIPITTTDISQAITDEVIQWILTIIQTYYIDKHFKILSLLGIKPFGPIIALISSLDSSECDVLSEMFTYIKTIYCGNAEELWEVIPPQFFLKFLDSSENSAKSVQYDAKMLRDLHITNDQIKLMIFQVVVMNLKNYLSVDDNFNEIIKMILVMIDKKENLFNAFVQMLVRVSSTDTPALHTFLANLKESAQGDLTKIDSLKFNKNRFYLPIEEHFRQQS